MKKKIDKAKAISFFIDRVKLEDAGELIEHLDLISSVVYKKKKELIFLENQQGRHVYFLVSGSIKLFKTNEEGKEAVIHFVEPGEFFAEILLFLHNRYPVSAMAIKDSVLLAIDAQRMFELIEKNPSFAMRLIGVFAQRLNYMANIIKNLSIMDARTKFLNYLKSLRSTESNVVELNIPKQEIALLLGIAPETFSRVLKQLSNDGYIEMEGKKIRILKEE